MKKYNQVIPEGKTVFVGIDIHRNSWHLTAVVEDEVVFSGALPPDPEALLKFLKRYCNNPIEAVYEAGYFGFWLYELLNDSGIKCIVTPPTLVPMEYGNHVKTDKRDSRKLAYLLSKNMLKKVWVPSQQQCGHRQVLRRRQKLIGDRMRVQHRIKSELSFYGITIAMPTGLWTARFVKQLQEISFDDPHHQQSFWILLEEYEFLNKLVEQQTHKKQAELLQTIPGIGPISAMSLLLELGDISRFARAGQLAAYVGLTPAQYSSGDNIRMGRITRCGKNSLRAVFIRMGRITRCGKNSLRAVLTEAAWTAIKKDPELRSVYDKLKFRRGSKKAIVAVSRRLLLRCRRVLLDMRPYCLKEAA